MTSGENRWYGVIKICNSVTKENYSCKGKQVENAQYENDLLVIDETKMDDAQVCDLWNFIKDSGIVAESDIPSEYSAVGKVFLQIMNGMNYVAGVIVSPDGFNFDKEANAYQYIAD